MHTYFPEWYQQVVLEPKKEELEMRWAGVEAVARDMDTQQALNVVRLFFGRPLKESDSIEWLADSFQEIDSNFPMRNNKHLLRVLSGVIIVHLIDERVGEIVDMVTLATLCAGCQGARSDVPIPDVVEYSQQYIVTRANRHRSLDRVSFEKAAGEQWNQLLKNFLTAWPNQNVEAVKEQVKAPFQKIAELINRMVDAINLLGEQIRFQKEESDILWWVFSEYSHDLEQPMANLDLAAACLVSGKELGDLIAVPPGPQYAKGFLDKMLRTIDPKLEKPVKLCDAINASPRKWRENWVDNENFGKAPDFFPVHIAAIKSLETTKKTAWYDAFETANGIKARKPFNPIDLAWQAYLEGLLIRFLHA